MSVCNQSIMPGFIFVFCFLSLYLTLMWCISLSHRREVVGKNVYSEFSANLGALGGYHEVH